MVGAWNGSSDAKGRIMIMQEDCEEVGEGQYL